METEESFNYNLTIIREDKNDNKEGNCYTLNLLKLHIYKT